MDSTENGHQAGDERGRPPTWLYVSKRLDIEFLPNEPLWSSPVLTLGPTAYYRLSARVLVWLEWAGDLLEQQWRSNGLSRDQLDAYLTAMEAVWLFAAEHLGADAIRTHRAKLRAGAEPTLPEVAGPL